MNTGPAAGSRCRTHTFNYELVTFQVEDAPYTVPRYGLEKWSKSAFRDMFSLPKSELDTTEGASAADPIHLPGCTKFEFESLLEMIYPQDILGVASVEALEKEQLAGALKLARMWDMPEVSTQCIKRLGELPLTPAEKISLGKRFRATTFVARNAARSRHIRRKEFIAGNAISGSGTMSSRREWVYQRDIRRLTGHPQSTLKRRSKKCLGLNWGNVSSTLWNRYPRMV